MTFKKKRKTAKTGKPLLSFADDEEEEGSPVPVSPVSSNKTPTTAAVDGEGNASTTLKKLKANPAVKFQPKNMTKAALKREAELKEEFRREYLAMEESVKATEFLLPFVFHNGKDIPGGVIRMKKGESVWLFLDRARKIGAEISTDQRSIRNWARVSVDDLMLVRGDIIVPQVRLSPSRQWPSAIATLLDMLTVCSTRTSTTLCWRKLLAMKALFSHIPLSQLLQLQKTSRLPLHPLDSCYRTRFQNQIPRAP